MVLDAYVKHVANAHPKAHHFFRGVGQQPISPLCFPPICRPVAFGEIKKNRFWVEEPVHNVRYM